MFPLTCVLAFGAVAVAVATVARVVGNSSPSLNFHYTLISHSKISKNDFLSTPCNSRVGNSLLNPSKSLGVTGNKYPSCGVLRLLTVVQMHGYSGQFSHRCFIVLLAM